MPVHPPVTIWVPLPDTTGMGFLAGCGSGYVVLRSLNCCAPSVHLPSMAETDEAVQAAVAAEDKYLADAATVTSEGRLSGFGPSTPSQTRQRSTNAWGTPYKEQ